MRRPAVAAVLTSLVGVGLLGLAPEADGHVQVLEGRTPPSQVFVEEGDTIALPVHGDPSLRGEIAVVVTVTATNGDTVVFQYEGDPYEGRVLLSLGEESPIGTNLANGWNRVGTLRGAWAYGTFLVHVEAAESYRTFSSSWCGQGPTEGPITLSINENTHSMHVCTMAPWTTTQVANMWHCGSFEESSVDPMDALVWHPCESPEHMALPYHRDTDGDRTGDDSEVNMGSNPMHAESTPSTDDDGDGQTNRNEVQYRNLGAFAGGLCSGAYGIVVAPSCSGYERPYNLFEGDVAQEGAGGPYVDDDGALWIWDAICTTALTDSGGYTACGDSSDHQLDAQPYNGDFARDGYGWRYVMDVPSELPEQHVDYMGLCDQESTDADSDGVPVFYLCNRRATVYPDGSTEDVETSPFQQVGDPDDADPDNPVDMGAILQQIEEVEELLDDPDEDGHSSLAEILGGSHPGRPDSTPATDDDGDGQVNDEEVYFGLPAGGLCSGAYGVVIAATCGGYESPYGNPSTVQAIAANQAGGVYTDGDDIWVWDAWCEPGFTGDAGSYDSCKAEASNYDGDATLYSGDWRSDGYGWRFMGKTGILTEREFDYIGTCDVATKDQDGDGFPIVRLCNRHVVVQPDGSFTDEERSVEQELGDPDDGDSENPLPDEALLVLVQDPDGDGYSTAAEASSSHPLHSASTPDTDDDGDGTQNRDEADLGLSAAVLCTGAYGVVIAAACGGYAAPYGIPTTPEQQAAQDVGGVYVDGNDVWVWDAVCFAAMGGVYEPCKGQASNYDVDRTLYSGDWRSDGYGWRFMGETGIFSAREFDYVGPCDTATEDKDGDDVPVVRLCNRHVVVQPDGTFTDDEQSPERDVGDPDDQDERVPVDRDGIAAQVDQLEQFIDDTVEDALEIVEQAEKQAEQLQRDVDELHNQTMQAVEDYQRLVGDLVNQTLEDLEARAQQLIEDLDDLVGLAESLREEAEQTATAAVEDADLWRGCTEEELGRYVSALDASSSNETSFRIQLTEGAVRWQQRSAECFAHVDFGALQPIVNATFAQLRFVLQVVEGNLGSGNRLYNDTLAFAQERADFLLNESLPLLEDEVEEVEAEMAALSQRVQRDIDSLTGAAMREVLEAIQERDPNLFDSLEDPSDADRGQEENRTGESLLEQAQTPRGRVVVVVSGVAAAVVVGRLILGRR